MNLIEDPLPILKEGPLHLTSLGAGVQSSTKALMGAHGLIEPFPDGSIFADTGAEPVRVYLWLRYLCGVDVTFFHDEFLGLTRPKIETGVYRGGKLPFPVHIVSHGDLIADTLAIHDREDGTGKWTYAGVPTFTLKGDGSRGIAPRQCTWTYKVEQLDKRQRFLVGPDKMRAWKRKHRPALVAIAQWRKECKTLKREWKKKHPELVGSASTWMVSTVRGQGPQFPSMPISAWQECQADPLVVCWLGISLDEVERMKTPRHPWQNFRYPLIDMRLKRSDCINWMSKNGYPTPPRSACDMCPYHTDNEWRRLRDDGDKILAFHDELVRHGMDPVPGVEAVKTDSFKIAIRFEEEYQKSKSVTLGWDSVPFLHASRIPLSDVDLSTDVDRGQGVLFGEPGVGESGGFGSDCSGMCGV